MKTYIIDQTDAPAVEFTGERIAFVSSEEGTRARNSGRWTELAVYKTNTRKYVLVISGKSRRPGERDLNQIHVERDLKDLLPYLFDNLLSKSLIDQLGVQKETIRL